MRAGIIGLAGVVLFSAKSVFARMAYEFQADPISVLYLRMLIALPFLLAIGFIYERRRPRHEPLKWKDILSVIALSILGYYISTVLDFIGLLYVEAAIERLIVFMYPTMVIILTAVFLKKRAEKRQVWAIAISYLGMILAFGDKLMVKNSPEFWLGVTLILLSALTYAIFVISSDRLIQRMGSVRFTTVATLTMCASIILHAFITGKANIGNLDKHIYWSCTLMALLSTVAPIYMVNYAMSRMGATNISIIASLGPVCTLLLAAMLLNEKVTMWQFAGTLVVVGGVLIISSKNFQLRKISFLGTLKKTLALSTIWGRQGKTGIH